MYINFGKKPWRPESAKVPAILAACQRFCQALQNSASSATRPAKQPNCMSGCHTGLPGRYNACQGAKLRAVQAYLASISYADEQLGRVLDALESSEYVENTVIIFWSDHGWHLGEKQHWHKSTLWEEATRIPLIIATPQTKPGGCSQSVSLLDLYPTLMELCGISGDQKFDGLSLMPQLRAPETKRRPALIEFRKGNAAVRSARWRYIRYSDGSEELYDHKTDPNEWENLAAKKRHEPIKQRLAKWLPEKWAEPALSKNAFNFDPATYSWKRKDNGKIFQGEKTAK